MAHAIPERNNADPSLLSLARSKKPKMLVVDDEPDNLDLLYRTFRRDFQVLRAESGVLALDVLATEGEVAVIISDQRMPEMKGTEFLSKTVPQFPNTMRIILTGFTDVEDLVEAINSGQVYKYITKPWDPNELKAVVHRAAETYELLKQRTEELRRAQMQSTLLSAIIQSASIASQPEDCLQSIASAVGETFETDGCILQLVENFVENYVENQGLSNAQGIYGKAEFLQNWLKQNPFLKEAIASRTAPALNIPSHQLLSQMQHHVDAEILAHLLPITFRNELLAVLSLQWQQPHSLREDELSLLDLSAQQIALALTCTRSYAVAV